MAEMKRESARVLGSKPQSKPSINNAPKYVKGLTPEEKLQREIDTKAAYEIWRQEREARIARAQSLRLDKFTRARPIM